MPKFATHKAFLPFAAKESIMVALLPTCARAGSQATVWDMAITDWPPTPHATSNDPTAMDTEPATREQLLLAACGNGDLRLWRRSIDDDTGRRWKLVAALSSEELQAGGGEGYQVDA